MPPYSSYFSDAQSAAAQWGLGVHQAETVCTTWGDVCTQLNGTYAKGQKVDAEDYFTTKLNIYDDPSTQKSYFFWDAEVSKAEFKELVDIQRGLLVLRGLCTGGQKQKARTDYEKIWAGIKRRVGPGDAAEGLCSRFNVTYCPDELMHYVHYLVKSPNAPSQGKKPWVFEHKGKTYLRVWYRK